jgi:hypothetical protein
VARPKPRLRSRAVERKSKPTTARRPNPETSTPRVVGPRRRRGPSGWGRYAPPFTPEANDSPVASRPQLWGVTVVLLYAVLLTLLVGLAMAYYELMLPYLRPHGFPPSWQILGLALLALGLLGSIFLISLFVDRDTAFDDVWWRAGGPMMLIGISLGVTVYATIAVYGRVLAIATAPTLRRDT